LRWMGGSQLKAQAFIEEGGKMRWERKGVEWQGIRKPNVIVVVEGGE
jgi:hypothetical protein